MYKIHVATMEKKTLQTQWNLLVVAKKTVLNTHSGSPLSDQMLWP